MPRNSTKRSNKRTNYIKCNICLDPITNKKHIYKCKKGCNGNYHKECAIKWAENNNTCPNCRCKNFMKNVKNHKELRMILNKNDSKHTIDCECIKCVKKIKCETDILKYIRACKYTEKDILVFNNVGRNALSFACESGYTKIIQYFIKDLKLDPDNFINAIDQFDEPACFTYACSSDKNYSLVEYLFSIISIGCIEILNECEDILKILCQNGCIRILKLFVESGVIYKEFIDDYKNKTPKCCYKKDGMDMQRDLYPLKYCFNKESHHVILDYLIDEVGISRDYVINTIRKSNIDDCPCCVDMFFGYVMNKFELERYEILIRKNFFKYFYTTCCNQHIGERFMEEYNITKEEVKKNTNLGFCIQNTDCKDNVRYIMTNLEYKIKREDINSLLSEPLVNRYQLISIFKA